MVVVGAAVVVVVGAAVVVVVGAAVVVVVGANVVVVVVVVGGGNTFKWSRISYVTPAL